MWSTSFSWHSWRFLSAFPCSLRQRWGQKAWSYCQTRVRKKMARIPCRTSEMSSIFLSAMLISPFLPADLCGTLRTVPETLWFLFKWENIWNIWFKKILVKKNEYICLYIKTARTARFSLFTFSSTFNLRAEPTSPSLPGRTTGSLAGAKELCTQGCSGRRGERILSLDLDSRNQGQNLAAGGKRQKCQIHQVGKHMACNSSSNAFAI